MKNIMKLFALVSMLTLGFAGSASAGIISMSADCTSNCSLIDMNTGDSLSLDFELADEKIVAWGDFTNADIPWFSFKAGSVEITSDTAVAFYVDAFFNATVDGIYNFNFRASESGTPDRGDMFSVGAFSSVVATAGNCSVADCSQISYLTSSKVSFTGFNFTIGADGVEVPEPGILGLLALSLFGLGFYRRQS